MRLSELKSGQSAVIKHVGGVGLFRKRILEMGFVRGKVVTCVQTAPMRDPIYFKILDYSISLRREDAALVEVEVLADGEEAPAVPNHGIADDVNDGQEAESSAGGEEQNCRTKRIRVALLGNPNCGKTSLFNLASGAREHVGNYSGVTVDAREAYFMHKGYRIEIIDLPGTYSLSPYSPEELYIRKFLSEETHPDMVLNVVDTTNLERNLYLTIQLKEMGVPVVMALNMFDEFEKKGDRFDYEALSLLLGIPMIPTVCRTGRGLENLFDRVINTYTGEERYLRRIRVNYGSVLEPEVCALQASVEQQTDKLPGNLPARYIAVKLLEGDAETECSVRKYLLSADNLLASRDAALHRAGGLLQGETAEAVITDQRYGYISGALRETYHARARRPKSNTDRIDHWIAHRVWGFPIFLLIMFVMFETTFVLGSYPMGWIESGVASLGEWIGSIMPDGTLKDLLIDGIIGGVGGVIVFLPNILILYFFISLMEDTGYMSRAAFIMDKLMHRMGLHGKSFIPLVMGFGCNVPAIMATRTIESRQSRLVTMLVLPLMSCSARLPVYLLLAGIFFPQSAGAVLFSLYFIGIALSVLVARIFRKIFFRQEDVPFVMELPPYRVPTSRSVLIHMWEKGKQYLRKMGTVIMLASIIIWALGYFPRNDMQDSATCGEIADVAKALSSDATAGSDAVFAQAADSINLVRAQEIVRQENSYIGRIGKFVEPVMRPLGFDWKMSVALLSGAAAKEIVVSTLGVIYTGDATESNSSANSLAQRIREDKSPTGRPSFTPLIAYSLMVFVLIYFPCIATIVAIGRESRRWQWAVFSAFYSCALAWIVSFIVYQGGRLLPGLGG